MEVQKHPSIEEIATFTIQSIGSWMTPIISYLQDGHLPQNTEEAKKIKKRAARFMILNDALYKRGFSIPYLKFVDEEEARYILEEVHGGICGDQAGPRSLVNKVVRTGYFWPTMQVDTAEIVKEVRQVPAIRECATVSSGDADDYSFPMAIRTMGN